MTPLDYTIRERGHTMEVQLTKAPSHALRDVFKEFGFRFSGRTQSWTGSIRYKDAITEYCERAKAESKRSVTRKDTLCWGCANADKGNISVCPWVREFQPVDGWTAKERKLSLNRMVGGVTVKDTSYEITECPLFTPEGGRK